MSSFREKDINHLWHPYTDITAFEAQEKHTVIERAEGVYLYEQGGRPLLDGIASWWCVNLGHSHPHLVAAIQKQAATMQHCILGGISHPSAVELAARLAELAPGDLNHAFFCGDGCSSVEAALKMALQYRYNLGQTDRNGFICLAEGYHGDSLGAVGVGFVPTFHAPFRKVVLPAHRAVSPHCLQCPYGKTPDACEVECFASMEALIHEHHATTTAVILEPLCQGAAGVRIYPEDYLRRLRKLCDQYDLLLIADEIAVGFGRTGAMFACERAGIVPDIMTIGKGLTGGYLPMSAAVVTSRVYDAFRNDPDGAGEINRTFFHGHTYTGNPVTSACALAALDTYRDEQVIEKLPPRIEQLRRGMEKIAQALEASKVRSMGMIGALEISEQGGGADRARAITQRANELGLFIRPLGIALYLWPPLVTTESQLAEMIDIFTQAVQNTSPCS